MPKDVRELRLDTTNLEMLPEAAQEILRFLGQEKGKAYDYREIFEGVISVKGAQALVPWAPFVQGMRALSLGPTLDGLNRAGLVRRASEGSRLWYYLPDETPPASSRSAARSEP